MAENKPFCISKWAVFSAWAQVRDNQGAAGVDGVSVQAFEEKLKNNLYRIWNRMSSGTYVPPPVRRVMIPKADGRERPLGIPTVGDRVAQMVVKTDLQREVEHLFHPDSYGYRPGKSALQAVGKCRERCWRYDWVVDLDIKGFFDNLDHSLMMRAVRRHTDCKWMLLCIERWLAAPAEDDRGKQEARDKGTPQGGVISPLLANIFLHHAFDQWISREYPDCPFERYADDIVIHCRTSEQAQQVLQDVRRRLRQCKLEVHPDKTRIVYCRDGNRRQDHPHIQFDFLGYSFRPRSAKNRGSGNIFTSYLPAISPKAQQAITAEIRGWNVQRRTERELNQLSRKFNPSIRGWVNYYGRYYPSALWRTFRGLNRRLVRWARRTYKRFRSRRRQATEWLRRLARYQPTLFAHWQIGVVP